MNNSQELQQAKMISAELIKRNPTQVLETTPVEITEALKEFCIDLCWSEPAFIPVQATEEGMYGFCNLTVAEKIKKEGGKPIHGWTIWEWPGVFWTAEFHMVWENPNGELIDVTPKPDGETSILFLQDFSFEPDFDFLNRPVSRRRRIRTDENRADTISVAISNLNASQRTYEENRAIKAGLSLEEWMDQKLPQDELNKLIDETIQACHEHEVYLDSRKDGHFIRANQALQNLIDRRKAKMTRLKLLVAGRKA
jgi:hypothetical protein